MFTGIIDHCGSLIALNPQPSGLEIGIRSKFTDLVLGESIAVDGICLTVTRFDTDTFYCDISPETKRLTTAKAFKLAQAVNLERAMRLSDRLGGHLVTGHVDQTVQIKAIQPDGEFIRVLFDKTAASAANLIVKKGSITINGVSLTVNDTSPTDFSVMLIPHTLKQTNLAFLRENDEVNVEFDIIARIVAEQCLPYTGAGPLSFIKE